MPRSARPPRVACSATCSTRRRRWSRPTSSATRTRRSSTHRSRRRSAGTSRCTAGTTTSGASPTGWWSSPSGSAPHSDSSEVREHLVEPRPGEREVGLRGHDRVGRERDPEAGGGDHVEIVGAVADRDAVGEGHAGLVGEGPQERGLRRAVDDGAAHPPGELAVDHLETIGLHTRDRQLGHEGVDDLVEAPRDQPDRPVSLGARLDELACARGQADLVADGVERLDRQPGERRDPLVQRGGEVELVAHRALGDRGDELLGAGVGGEQLDLLGRDEGGVDVHDEQTPAIVRAHALVTLAPLGTTVTPPSVTTNPRERSSSRSTPTVAPSSTTTSLSRIALRTWACRCTSVPSMSTEPSTSAHEFTRTPGESTDVRTSPPETTTPGEMIESVACPTRSPTEWTNFAGGSPVYPVCTGQESL